MAKVGTFDDLYMRKRMYLAWRGDIITKAINDVLNPESVIDVGCSVGEFVDSFLKLGKIAYGIDSSESAKKFFIPSPGYFILADIGTMDGIRNSPFGLCLCFEVIIILDETQHEALADNLCKLSDQILLSVKTEEKKPWVERMMSRGYQENPRIVDRIKEPLAFYKGKPAMKAIYYGMTFFRKEITAL